MQEVYTATMSEGTGTGDTLIYLTVEDADSLNGGGDLSFSNTNEQSNTMFTVEGSRQEDGTWLVDVKTEVGTVSCSDVHVVAVGSLWSTGV